jgi:hypothetical protein
MGAHRIQSRIPRRDQHHHIAQRGKQCRRRAYGAGVEQIDYMFAVERA